MLTGARFTPQFYHEKVLDWYKEDQKNIVYMVDLSIEPYTEMIKFNNFLNQLNIQFYWIDHHISAIEATQHYNIPGLQSTKKSGCALTWDYLCNNSTIIDESDEEKTSSIPLLIKYVSDFDTWNKKSKFSWENELYPLIYFLNSFDPNLNDNKGSFISLLSILLYHNDMIAQYLKFGFQIYQYILNEYKSNTRKIYETEWNDYHCLVINSSFKGSTQFECVPNYKDYDLLIVWSFNGKEYEYGLYSSKKNIDCGTLCRIYLNGGGHFGAAGGYSKKYIFD